jgi:hypothetical protein
MSSGLLGYLLAGGMALITILAALLGARKSGKDAAINEVQAKRLDAVKDKKESDDAIDRMGDTAVDDQLNPWLRDKK